MTRIKTSHVVSSEQNNIQRKFIVKHYPPGDGHLKNITSGHWMNAYIILFLWKEDETPVNSPWNSLDLIKPFCEIFEIVILAFLVIKPISNKHCETVKFIFQLAILNLDHTPVYRMYTIPNITAISIYLHSKYPRV